ncbi:DEAD/DEAH box helicase [Patescibacteria group bacterium]|nr:DEAD/DEAH box helicase [Patescibacteria group bacterium]
MSSTRHLDRSVASAFYGQFPTLRPVQEAAIQPILQGKNVVLSSGTGSGKTEAVLAPLISLYRQEALDTDSLAILYIAPTKALVNDLEKRIRLPLDKINFKLAVRHGDHDDLASGVTPNLLITTPESLEVLLLRKEKRLSNVKAVVIDEVHLLYNTQRGLQLSVLLKRLNQFTDRRLQWAALSATVSVLSNVRDFLFGPVEEAVFLQYPAQRTIDAHIRQVNDEESFLRLVRRLVEGKNVKLLVFANSRRICEKLVSVLARYKLLEHIVFAHYSSLSPELRVETEKKFASSRCAICVSTSTLELGIDIGDIDAVILWGAPASAESFLQRIGRGNRRQNKTNAICLIPDDSETPLCDALRFLALIDAAQNGELPVLDPYDLYGASGQQCLSMIASENGRYMRIADLCKFFDHKVHLSRPTIEEILAELANNGYLQRHGFKNQYGADQKLYELIDYRMIYGNFGANSNTVDVSQESKKLGTVPSINLLRVKPGMHVRFAGKSWLVRKASAEGFILEPLKARSRGEAVDFIYPGGGIGFDAFLCNRMWNIIHSEPIKQLMAEELYRDVHAFGKRLVGICGSDQIPYIEVAQGYRYFTFGGYLLNKALALITNQWDFKADDISLRCASVINWGSIPAEPKDYEPVFDSLFEMSGNQSLYQTLLPTTLQLQEYLQNWLKDKTIIEVLRRLQKSEAVRVDPALFDSVAADL